MSVLVVLLIVALIGLVAWALTAIIPMPAQFQTLIIVIAVVIAVLYVLQAFGVISGPALRLR